MVDLKKMQNKIDKLMSIFTNIVKELDTQINRLNNAIDVNRQQIVKAEVENRQYAEKIDEYQALKNKVESIIK